MCDPVSIGVSLVSMAGTKYYMDKQEEKFKKQQEASKRPERQASKQPDRMVLEALNERRRRAAGPGKSRGNTLLAGGQGVVSNVGQNTLLGA